MPIFGDTIDYPRVRVNRRRWWPLQPKRIAMAPDGALWFHPDSPLWRDDFADADLLLQALFLHEMTHVAQVHRGGGAYLLLMRHPFCRYDYRLQPGKPFTRYGIEQQAEIVRHGFLLRNGVRLPGCAPLDRYEAILPLSQLPCRAPAG